MKKIKKAYNLVYRKFVSVISYISNDRYMKLIKKHYKKNGMKISDNAYYIHPTVYFDGTDYELITIEEGVSISRDVIFMTHDYSMKTVYKDIEGIDKEKFEKEFNKTNLLTARPITVGSNTFIGYGAFIMPGSTIGKNCLIGVRTVVRGNIPDNSVVIGNPCKVIGKTSDWLNKKSRYFNE